MWLPICALRYAVDATDNECKKIVVIQLFCGSFALHQESTIGNEEKFV